jgi:hypothetical protein
MDPDRPLAERPAQGSLRDIMRRTLQFSAAACVGLGLALWFFGGMNTGPSQWTEEAHATDPAHVLGTERRFVFRPGSGFVAAAAAAGAILWAASLVISKPRRS